ncbi:hypothetical protein LUZ60_009214 [Juncus effusus]|nr:hypothetical protein LUZ60_009214 [Juncus effusus]
MGFCPCFFGRGSHEETEEEEGTSGLKFGQTGIRSAETIPRFESNESSERSESVSNGRIARPLSATIRTFSYGELAAFTKNFREDLLLGQGGFGSVYKGWLEDGQVVAVKQLDRNGLQGNREFLVEVLMLSLLHHPHLVNLIGYCNNGNHRLLVYEFMPLGSLEDHLHDLKGDRAPLDWPTRMRIISNAAEGLEYLHDKASPPVIFRDFKPSNILLGHNYFAKLSDFGLAKLGPTGDRTHVTTRVMGTQGYCAPEYAATGKLTVKSDIYSFGVVILEIVTGRRAFDPNRSGLKQELVQWARPLFKDQRKFSRMADPALQGQFPRRGLFQALALAAMCLQENVIRRPPIKELVTAFSYLASQNNNNGSSNSNNVSINGSLSVNPGEMGSQKVVDYYIERNSSV